MMRPRPARWFEIVLAREDVTAAVAAIAATGAVELETRSACCLPEQLEALRPLLGEYRTLAARYQAWWPQHGLTPSPFAPQAPATLLGAALGRLRAWGAAAEALIRRLQQAEAEAAELELWRGILVRLADSRLDLGALAAAGPLLEVRLLTWPAGVEPGFAAAVLVRPLAGTTAAALVVAAAAAMADLVAAAAAAHGSAHRLPALLRGDAHQALAAVELRLTELERDRAVLHGELTALHHRHELHRALGDALRLQWLLQHVSAIDCGTWLVTLSGWNGAAGPGDLDQALRRAGIRALLHHPPPPAGKEPPLLLSNPWWASPFEVFARALGMPGAAEADPSRLLALVVPLMFGYMFGDFGQGLVIAAGAFLLRRRFALARLFVAGGLAAALFGLLFGSSFSHHGALPALWLQPLAEPKAVLLVPIAGGALLLLLGLLLAGLQALWAGELRRWLLADAGLLAVYLGLLLGLLAPAGFALAGLGALACIGGRAWLERRPAAALVGLGELVERTVQLLVNTLSFSRVGAFALAHAGLSAAIVALAGAADGAPTQVAVLALGNAFVIALETLVVSIQTTRLVLFEFFVRFLSAGGRPFRPLPPPLFALKESPS